MVVEKFRPIVGMHFDDGERDTLENAPKASLHGLIPASQHHDPLAPAGGHINHLKGMAVLASAALPAMMHQIGLAVPRLADVPRDAFHGNPFADLVRSFWPTARQALLLTAM